MPARPTAQHDPKFAVLEQDVHAKGRHIAASHPPPRTESSAAQAAARPPADDKEAQGKVANADKMNDAKPHEFDKAAFIRAVEQAIAQQAPKNLDEADKFADLDKPEQVRKDVQSRVGQGEQASASEIATTTAAPPDTAKAVEKKVVPLAPDRPPGAPATPDPADAVPDKLPPSVTDLSAGPRQVDAQVTEPQLMKSNEPAFQNAVRAKHGLEQDSARAIPAMRHHEAATLKAATANAQRHGGAAMHGLAVARVATGRKVTAGKQGAKGSDEAKRAQVTTTLQKVFDAAKKDVEGILSGLDKKVDDQFGREEKAARDAFTAEHKQKMREYKDKRYAGLPGKARWLRDLFRGLPEEANQIFTTARDHYIARMRTVIADVADTIATELHRAKARIAKGRSDLQDAVRTLPADLRVIGRQAADDFAGKFDEGKLKRLNAALVAGASAVDRYRDRPVAGRVLRPLLGAIRLRYGLAELRTVMHGDHWAVYGRINPDGTKDTGAKVEGTGSARTNPNFEADAKAFEERLAGVAGTHRASNAAMAAMAAKAKAYIQARVGGRWGRADQALTEILQVIGQEGAQRSGFVGVAVGSIRAVFDGGTLSERFVHIVRFFTEILGRDLLNEAEEARIDEFIAKAKLNKEFLEERRAVMVAAGLREKTTLSPAELTLGIAPVPPGSLVEQKDASRTPRKGGDERIGLTVAQTGLRFSSRQEAEQRRGDPNWDRYTSALQWTAGAKHWMMNREHAWVGKQIELGLPLGAVEFGCGYTPGRGIYRNIAPLTEAELLACGNGKFPDQVAPTEASPRPSPPAGSG